MTTFNTRVLDDATTILFEMAKSQSTEQLRTFVGRIGVPPLKKFGSWVDAHVEFGAGAGIEWQGPSETSLLIQIQEFKVLRDAIRKVSDPIETEEVVSGMLTGASIEKHTFEMRLGSGALLSGKFGDAINAQQRAELPKRYSAKIKTTKTINLATEKEETIHFLVELLSELQI